MAYKQTTKGNVIHAMSAQDFEILENILVGNKQTNKFDGHWGTKNSHT